MAYPMIEGQRVKLSEEALRKNIMRSPNCKPGDMRATVLKPASGTPGNCERVKFDHLKTELTTTISRDFIEVI